MSQKTILIAGIVSNEARNLESEIERLHNAFSSSNNIFWIVIESDSTDNTLEVLQRIERKYLNFKYISLGNLRKFLPIRTERLAFCRNQYLDYLREIEKKQKIDYLVVSDFDKTNLKLSSKIVGKSLQLDADWSALFASQKYFYYDLWAFRHLELCEHDIHRKISESMSLNVSLRRLYFHEIIKKMFIISRKKGLLKVESAFGGLAIYKSKFITKNVKYVGLDSNGNEVCEHLSMNFEIGKNSSNLYVNADLVNHNINVRVWRALLRWTVYLFLPNYFALKIHRLKFGK